MAYELIETIEVGSGGAASIEFTSIPQDGVDLLLLVSARAGNHLLRANGDTGSNYSRIRLEGDGASAYSDLLSSTSLFIPAPSSPSDTANTFGNLSLYFSNYTSSAYKSISADGVSENNGTYVTLSVEAGLWSNSSAISSLQLNSYAGNYTEYTTASLYKIS